MKRQTDRYGKAMNEKVKKLKNKTKIYILLNKMPNISVWKQPSSGAKRKYGNKTKSSLQIRIWKSDNKNNGLLLV